MSRSRWALAETRWRRAFIYGAGKQRRLEGRLVLERRISPGGVSATRYAVILLAAGMLVMAAEPARALAASVKEAREATPAHPADPVVVLARGSGYGGGTNAALVRSLQRRLDSSGFRPGPIDGLFGSRTEHAVELFQGAHGLVVDGIAGPVTLSALRTPATELFPGAGYAGAGSGAVRRLQRQLRRDGFSPGPIDGRYGPLTARAVSRFQAAHGLQVDGIAGLETFGELKHVAAGRPTASRSRPRPRPTTPSHPRTPSHREPRLDDAFEPTGPDEPVRRRVAAGGAFGSRTDLPRRAHGRRVAHRSPPAKIRRCGGSACRLGRGSRCVE